MVPPDPGLAFLQAVAQALAGMPVCHISHHPLDGLRSSEHACPLLFADATDASYEVGMFLAQPPRLFSVTAG